MTQGAAGDRLPTILLVEDNRADQALLRTSFEDLGLNVRVVVARDGAEAMAFLREAGEPGHPAADLILLDLNLPKMPGQILLKTIKEDSLFRSIPVIVFTGSESEEDIRSSYDLQCSGYIVKPADLDRLAQVVRAINHYWLDVVRLPRD